MHIQSYCVVQLLVRCDHWAIFLNCREFSESQGGRSLICRLNLAFELPVMYLHMDILNRRMPASRFELQSWKINSTRHQSIWDILYREQSIRNNKTWEYFLFCWFKMTWIVEACLQTLFSLKTSKNTQNVFVLASKTFLNY